MLKKLLSVVFSVALIGASGLALAKKGGEAGGQSGSHISSEGVENTNGPNAADRDKGQERAEDRKTRDALDTDTSTDAHSHKHQNHGHHGKKH